MTTMMTTILALAAVATEGSMTGMIIVSIFAVVVAATGLAVSLIKGKTSSAKNHAARMTKLEEDVKDLKHKHSEMISDVDKLTDSLSTINTKQAVMGVKLDTLQIRMDNVFETVTMTQKSLNEYMLSSMNALTKVQTEIAMLHSGDEKKKQ